jgi:hypothetical protein
MEYIPGWSQPLREGAGFGLWLHFICLDNRGITITVDVP